MSFPLLRSLGLDLIGGSPLEILAGKIVLAAELGHLKLQLSYHGTGRRTIVDRANVPHSNWEKFCAVESGITDSSRRTYKKWSELLQRRLRLSAKPESLALAELMASQPSTLTPEQRQRLIEGIVHLALLPQDTASSLSREARTETPAPPEPAETGEFDSIPLAVSEDPAENRKAMELPPGVRPEYASRMAEIERRVVNGDAAAKIAAMAREAGVSKKNARRIAEIVLQDNLFTFNTPAVRRAALQAAELLRREYAPKKVKGPADKRKS